jgi:hypothetical protein
MRIEIKMLTMLLPLVLVAVFSILFINAHAIDDDGSGSADQLIDASNGISPYVVDTRFPASPQESRRLQGIDNNLNNAAPGSSSNGATSAQDSTTQAESGGLNQNTTENSESTNETASSMTTSAPETATASGNWSFVLNDSTNGSTNRGTLKEVSLAINESDHVVLGSGNITEGNDTRQVTATGLEDGNRLDLNLTTLGTVNLYMLSLTTNGDSAAGEYRAHSADGQSWTGNATGTKSLPQS